MDKNKIDLKLLKKYSYLLIAIIEEGFKARLEHNKIFNPNTEADGEGEICVGLDMCTGFIEDLHKIPTKIMEQYEWDLKEFFKVAANPRVHLYRRQLWDDIVDEDYSLEQLPKEKIEKRAEQSMINIENLIRNLE